MDNVGLIADSKRVQDVGNQDDSKVPTTQSYSFVCELILALTMLAVSVKSLNNKSYPKAFFDTVSALTFFILAFGMTEISMRIYRLLVELFCLNSKYGGNVAKVFETLNFNTISWVTVALSFSTFLVLHISFGNSVQHVWNLGPFACIPVFVCSVLVCQLVGLRDSKLNTAELINSMGGVDYGTGMAYSYFYGYLKIILPQDGANKGIRFKMEQYEADQNVTIPVKKLFILIPKSAHIPPDLREASNNWLESTTLESEIRDRAGVKNRPYRNTVYKIHPGGEGKNHRPIYVTTEGATPLLTLWEILKHDHPQTAAYRDHRQQIISAFCKTLQTLLNNDPQCTNVCELVIYDDYNAQGKMTNVGEILLKRINQQAPYSV